MGLLQELTGGQAQSYPYEEEDVQEIPLQSPVNPQDIQVEGQQAPVPVDAPQAKKEEDNPMKSWLNGLVNDDARMGRVIIALNSMRLNPDQGIQQMGIQMIKGVQDTKNSKKLAQSKLQEALLKRKQKVADAKLKRKQQLDDQVTAQENAKKLFDYKEENEVRSPKSSFIQMTGAELNKQLGTNLEEGKLFNVDENTNKITGIGGGDTNINMVDESKLIGTQLKVKKDFDANVKPYKDQQDTLDKTYASIANTINKGNAVSGEALDNFGVQLVNAGRMYQHEVTRLAGAGSIPAKVANVFSKWASGVPSDAKIEDYLEFADALEEVNVKSYNSTVSDYEPMFNKNENLAVLSNFIKPKIYSGRFLNLNKGGKTEQQYSSDDYMGIPGVKKVN